MTAKPLTIGAVARQSGVSVETIRYYQREGLVIEPQKPAREFSPGGIGSSQSFEKVNFCTLVLDVLKRKVLYMEFYKRNFNNKKMAML